MTYFVSGGALNSTYSLTHSLTHPQCPETTNTFVVRLKFINIYDVPRFILLFRNKIIGIIL